MYTCVSTKLLSVKSTSTCIIQTMCQEVLRMCLGGGHGKAEANRYCKVDTLVIIHNICIVTSADLSTCAQMLPTDCVGT